MIQWKKDFLSSIPLASCLTFLREKIVYIKRLAALERTRVWCRVIKLPWRRETRKYLFGLSLVVLRLFPHSPPVMFSDIPPWRPLSFCLKSVVDKCLENQLPCCPRLLLSLSSGLLSGEGWWLCSSGAGRDRVLCFVVTFPGVFPVTLLPTVFVAVCHKAERKAKVHFKRNTSWK